MKITEECINHNALRLIAEIAREAWNVWSDERDAVKYLTHIDGIINLADALKEVLKNGNDDCINCKDFWQCDGQCDEMPQM